MPPDIPPVPASSREISKSAPGNRERAPRRLRCRCHQKRFSSCGPACGELYLPSRLVIEKTPLDQMPAATPKHERLDETPAKAIHSTIINNRITVTVRTPTPPHAAARCPLRP